MWVSAEVYGMLDIEKALKLTKPAEILAVAKKAEQSNCEVYVIRTLYRRYYDACDAKERTESRR